MSETKHHITVAPVKPFLKWAGSKRQLLPHFRLLYPAALLSGGIKNYYEPFAGSGAVLFDVLQRYAVESAFLSDVNEDLVLTYSVVQLQVADLTAALFLHQKKYLALGQKERLAYFYEQRLLFNQARNNQRVYTSKKRSVERAAQFIFLNRTCFNGLFRVNSQGIFNTPAGDYVKPSICDENNLRAVSSLLQTVVVRKSDFARSVNSVPPGSFVYFDPPYRPLTATSNFTAYSKSSFTDVEQVQLAGVCSMLNKKGIYFMLSNADTPDGFFDRLYKDFRIIRVPARRLINADASRRGQVNEIVVTNYPQ